jgi:phosphoenolpyruvate carboxykinase (ATP)
VIRLSPEGEPEIYQTTRMFGTILENVVTDEGRRPQFDADDITENTRASYPLEYIPNFVPSGQGGHPRNIVFLTADAYGVLPPIARLSADQAMYHFLSGYTAKVAGTERGVTEPKATFSACFGAPFLILHPSVYADMLGRKIDEHQVRVWLVNTGWTGGPYGEGHRMKLRYTRAMVRAALAGELDDVATEPIPSSGCRSPHPCPTCPTRCCARARPGMTGGLRPPGAEARRDVPRELRKFADNVPQPVRDAGPKA